MRRDLLNEALLGLREAGEGKNEDDLRSDAADETRARLLRTLERRRRNHHTATLIVAVIVVSLCASTSWAAISGNLPEVVYELLETVAGNPARDTGETANTSPPSPAASTPRLQEIDPIEPEAIATSEVEAVDEVEVARELEARRERRSRQIPPRSTATPIIVAPPSPAAEPQPEATSENLPTPDAQALYQAAHRVHFVRCDYSAALAAWERYLDVAPGGRFGLEARYNRAIALVRLGRGRSAITALRPFADGVHGGYRQEEALRLIEALEGFARPDGT